MEEKKIPGTTVMFPQNDTLGLSNPNGRAEDHRYRPASQCGGGDFPSALRPLARTVALGRR